MIRRTILVWFVASYFSAAWAVPILQTEVNSAGDLELIGALNVEVLGVLYDVEFVDGTCIALFSGCDDANDFTFDNQSQAHFASQALLSAVILDQPGFLIDSEAFLTRGCSSNLCEIATLTTPFELTNGFEVVAGGKFRNFALDSMDIVGTYSVGRASDLTTDFGGVFARWSLAGSATVAVPEPTTLLLLMTGLFGIGLTRRCKRR